MTFKSQHSNSKTMKLLPSLPRTAKGISNKNNNNYDRKKPTITLEGVNAEHSMNLSIRSDLVIHSIYCSENQASLCYEQYVAQWCLCFLYINAVKKFIL